MPRYELSDGKSSKFWEINLKGKSYTVNYGRIGTDGQSSTKTFNDAKEAKAAAEKVTASKVKKGYTLVSSAKKAAKAASASGNTDLESMLKANPVDSQLWQIYSDQLQTQGDIRGEMIALAMAYEKSPKSKTGKEAKKRYDRIFEDNKEEWFGEALQYMPDQSWWGQATWFKDYRDDPFDFTWKNGYLTHIGIMHQYGMELPYTYELLELMLASPTSQFLQSLTIGTTQGVEDGDMYFGDCVSSAVSSKRAANIKHLNVGYFWAPIADLSWSTVGDCKKIFKTMPELEFLGIRGQDVTLGNIKHDKLKRFQIVSCGLNREAVKSVANANLPALEELEVWTGSEYRGSNGNAKMLKNLFLGKGYPSLKSLALKNSEYANDMAAAIVGAPILVQLDELDFSMGTMTDIGAQAILDNASEFKHLKSLDLSDNFISDALCKKLKKAFGKKVNVSDQGYVEEDIDDDDEYDDDDYYEPYTYVSVGE